MSLVDSDRAEQGRDASGLWCLGPQLRTAQLGVTQVDEGWDPRGETAGIAHGDQEPASLQRPLQVAGASTQHGGVRVVDLLTPLWSRPPKQVSQRRRRKLHGLYDSASAVAQGLFHHTWMAKLSQTCSNSREEDIDPNLNENTVKEPEAIC